MADAELPEIEVIDSRELALLVKVDLKGHGTARAFGVTHRQAAYLLHSLADQFDRTADECGEPLL